MFRRNREVEGSREEDRNFINVDRVQGECRDSSGHSCTQSGQQT